MVPMRAILASLVLLSACSVGDVTSGSGGGVDASTDGGGGTGTGGGMKPAQFDATIKPMLMTKNCISCHSGVQAPNFSSFTALQTVYKNGPSASNKLLTEAADGAVHNGATYFTTAEKVTVGKW